MISNLMIFINKAKLSVFYRDATTLRFLVLGFAIALLLLKINTNYYGFKIGFWLIKHLVCWFQQRYTCWFFLSAHHTLVLLECIQPCNDSKLSFFSHCCFGINLLILPNILRMDWWRGLEKDWLSKQWRMRK